MIINVSYDSSVTSLSPILQTEYEAAVSAAVSYYEQTIATNITVNIDFGYGEVDGQAIKPSFVSESEATTTFISYQVLRAAAVQADKNSPVGLAAAALLPASDPTDGAGSFIIKSAETKALARISQTPISMAEASGNYHGS
jgi:hypothetical protein